MHIPCCILVMGKSIDCRNTSSCDDSFRILEFPVATVHNLNSSFVPSSTKSKSAVDSSSCKYVLLGSRSMDITSSKMIGQSVINMGL